MKAGDARVDTGGAPIEFGGLTRPSGGGVGSSRVTTDYANFCCPTYLDQMVELIKRNWNQKQGASGEYKSVHDPSGRNYFDVQRKAERDIAAGSERARKLSQSVGPRFARVHGVR